MYSLTSIGYWWGFIGNFHRILVGVHWILGKCTGYLPEGEK